jgi:hypothetical protein
LVTISAQAQNPWVLYDDFNSEFMDIENWGTNQRIDAGVMIVEYVRELHGGRLHMMGRAFGNTSPNQSPNPPYSGVRAGDINANLITENVLKSLKVFVKVKDVAATGCPDSNTTPTSSRARLVGFFFNAGEISPPPEPPSNPGRINDVLAQVRIQRSSDSIDKSQVLEVWADVVRCTDPQCNIGVAPTPVLLGNVKLGQWSTIEVGWNGDRQFNFKLNKEPTTVFDIPPSWSVNPVSSPWATLGVSHRLASCPSDERAMGFVDAEFDNLFISEYPNP